MGKVPGMELTVALAAAAVFLVGAEVEKKYQPPPQMAIPPKQAGTTQYVRIPVAALVYTNVTRWPTITVTESTDPPTVITKRKEVPPPPPIPDTEVARLKDELRQGVIFYWINSSMKCLLDLSIVVIDEPLDPSQIYDTSEYRSPLPEDVKKRLAAAGLDPISSNPITSNAHRVSGLLHMVIEQVWDSKNNKWRYSGGGGGFTVGPDVYGVGVSWWQVTPGDAGSNNEWLMVHEFHHDLDAMFAFSNKAGEDYWFNHPSPTEDNVARLGEHYDDNAYILRRWKPLEKWFEFNYGEAKRAADADEDGFPDGDTALPLDEQRFGSSPARADTDDDGLTDLQEAMAWNGVNRGLGETFMSGHYYPNPKNPDTDGDGLIDGDDPYPLYPISPWIEMKAATIDGKLEEGESKKFADIRDARVDAHTYLQWDELNTLYFAFLTDQPSGVKIQMDVTNDGWFTGRDNYRILIDKDGKVTDATIVDDMVVGQWPHDNKDLVKKEDIKLATGKHGDKYLMEIGIPHNHWAGLSLIPCQIIGLNLGVKPDDGKPFHVTVFEPHTLVQVRLVKLDEPCKV
ncbi:MAG: hypothetical protein ACREJQ_01675 [bacterium]